MKRVFGFLVLTATLLSFASSGTAAGGAPANGPIIFQSTRAPGDFSAGMLWQASADGSPVQGPLTPLSPGCSSCFNSSNPSFSPDGTRVAFVTGLFGNGEMIAVMDPDGTNMVAVAGHDNLDPCFLNEAPTWSPDGRQIAFTSCNGLGHAVLDVVNADGTGFHPVLIAPGPPGDIHKPDWSPDGSEIAYERTADDGFPHIFTAHPDGTGETDLGAVGYDPAYSPDGTQIVYDFPRGSDQSGIWMMNADGSGKHQLTSAIDEEPAWSPDGTKLVFASERNRNGFQLWTMNPDGSDPTQITDANGFDAWPTWGSVPSHDVVVSDCADASLQAFAFVQGNFVANDLPDCHALDLPNVVNVGGNLTITNTGAGVVNLGSLATVGGNVTITDNESATVVDVGSLATVGGSVTITDNSADTVVNLGSSSQVAGSVTVTSGGNLDLGGLGAAGNVTLTGTGADVISGQTAAGTTTINFVDGVAALRALIPSGAFTGPVPFTIERQGDAAAVTGIDAAGAAALVDPVAGYRFTFGVPVLNADAQVTFTVELSQLDADTRTALTTGESATIAVRGDAAGSTYKAYPRCGAGETPAADGCASVTFLDANRQPTSDPGSAAFAVFDGLAGHFSEYAVALVTPLDTTPPVIGPVVSGTLGGAGFYTSDVTVAWDVKDPESAVSSSSGCATSSVTSDTLGTTFTCTATSAGGTATKSVTIARDATSPTVAYTGNLGTYDVDATVAIACAAADPAPGSGLESSTCANANGPAYTFGAGAHTLSASASDRAGNRSSGSTTFTVVVTPAALCRVTRALAGGSARRIAGICVALEQITPKLLPTAKAQLVAAYKRGLQTLVQLGYLTPAQATTLGRLADAI